MSGKQRNLLLLGEVWLVLLGLTGLKEDVCRKKIARFSNGKAADTCARIAFNPVNFFIGTPTCLFDWKKPILSGRVPTIFIKKGEGMKKNTFQLSSDDRQVVDSVIEELRHQVCDLKVRLDAADQDLRACYLGLDIVSFVEAKNRNTLLARRGISLSVGTPRENKNGNISVLLNAGKFDRRQRMLLLAREEFTLEV